jgi:hypothetical protein
VHGPFTWSTSVLRPVPGRHQLTSKSKVPLV